MSIRLMVVFLLIYCISSVVYATPFGTDGACALPCEASCAPACEASCCTGNAGSAPALPGPPGPAGAAGAVPPPKQQFTIGSVEEGETKECDDKGFNSPTDNSEDPPGTITIPLPPTMYVPPRPGEAPKELPLPDFKIPESILQGKLPDKSMTLTPEQQSSFNAAYPAATPPVVNHDAAAPAAPAEPAKEATPAEAPVTPELSKEAMVTVSEGDKIVVAPPPLPPPPPPPPPSPPPSPASSGYNLQFPKLPPVTVSEIPGRANRLPPLPPKPAPKGLAALGVAAARPSMVHVLGGIMEKTGENNLGSGISAAGPSLSTANVVTVPTDCSPPMCVGRSGR